MGLNQCPCLSTKKEQKQNVCKNLTEIVDVFDMVGLMCVMLARDWKKGILGEGPCVRRV